MAEIGEVSIERGLDQIKQGIADIGSASRAIEKDLKSVNAGLRLDPSNTELLAQKQELLAQKLENSRDRSAELSAAITELNRIKTENGQLTDGQSKLLATYQQQLKETEIQVTALTGATQQHTEATDIAEETTKSFSQSMTEFQSNLRAVNQIMGGTNTAFKLLGGDSDSAMGKFLSQSQQSVKMMTDMASVGKLLGKENTALSKTFGTVAMSAGAAIAAYSLGSSALDSFSGENKRIAAILMTTAGALGAVTIAALAAAGTLSWGVAVPIILASVGAGVAGMKTLLEKETKSLESASASAVTSGRSSSSPADYSYAASTPTVPTASSSSNSTVQSQIIMQSISEKQIESAVVRAILQTGMNEKEYVGKAELNGREIARFLFNDLLAINAERGNPLKV